MKKSGFIFLLIFTSAYSSFSQKQSAINDSITWEIPNDGGTPRDPSRISKTGPNEYHIQSSFEDGGESVLKHAVSRMDLICKNNGTKPVILTLHIDLSGDGNARTMIQSLSRE